MLGFRKKRRRVFVIPTMLLVLAMFTATAKAQTVVIRVDGLEGSASPPGFGDGWQANAYRYLSDAIARAAFLLDQSNPPPPQQVQVWVRGSTTGVPYHPDRSATAPNGSGNRSLSFNMRNNVGLYGGFEGDEPGTPEGFAMRNPATFLTILSGDLLGNDGPPGSFTNLADNSYHVVVATGVAATAVIDGFTIKGANAALSRKALRPSVSGVH